MSDDDDDAAQLEGDRKTVESLRSLGDSLTKARLVDHWAYFETASARDCFIDDVVQLGFTVTDMHGEAKEPNPFCARVSRVDHVDLESIHRTVMTLFAAAKRYAGEYDGWECPVEAAN